MKYKLVFLNGKFKGRRFIIGEGKVVIGRHADCQIDLDDDDEVSRRHAVLETREDGVYIVDLGALNRIAVNGTKTSEARLNYGDTVELGRTQFQFKEVESHKAFLKRKRGTAQLVATVLVLVILVVEVAYLSGLTYYGRSSMLKDHAVEVAKVPETKTPAQPVPGKAEAALAKDTEAAPGPAEETNVKKEKEAPAEKVEIEPESEEKPAKPVQKMAAPVEPSVEDAATVAKPLQEPVPDRPAKEPEAVAESEVAASTEAPEPSASAPTEETAAPDESPQEPPVPADAWVDVKVPQAEEAGVEETEEPEDPVLARAKSMLKTALKAIAANDVIKADQELERIEIMAPDFLPPYVERARLYERRGMLSRAGEQWGAVLERAVGSPLYEEAAAERIRIARAQDAKAREARDRQARRSGAAGGLARRIRITSVERQKFQTSSEFDEMRLVRVEMKPKAAERVVDTDDVRVVVTFFDKEKDSKRLGPTRAVVPADPLLLDGEWEARDTRSVTAAYIVPEGFRQDEEDEYGQQRSYYGYVVRVFYKGELQDQEARPNDLAAEIEKLSSPFAESIIPAP